MRTVLLAALPLLLSAATASAAPSAPVRFGLRVKAGAAFDFVRESAQWVTIERGEQRAAVEAREMQLGRETVTAVKAGRVSELRREVREHHIAFAVDGRPAPGADAPGPLEGVTLVLQRSDDGSYRRTEVSGARSEEAKAGLLDAVEGEPLGTLLLPSRPLRLGEHVEITDAKEVARLLGTQVKVERPLRLELAAVESETLRLAGTVVVGVMLPVPGLAEPVPARQEMALSLLVDRARGYVRSLAVDGRGVAKLDGGQATLRFKLEHRLTPVAP